MNEMLMLETTAAAGLECMWWQHKLKKAIEDLRKRNEIAIICAALLLSGCATYQNPINTSELATVESAYGVALAVAVGYRQLPLCRTGAPTTLTNVCARRSIVIKLQTADRVAQAALIQARSFVKNNPTLDAMTVITVARNAVASFQLVESTNGVN